MIAAAINLNSKSWLMLCDVRLASGDISAEDAYQALGKIRTSQSINHDLLFKFIAAAIISVSFLYLQGLQPVL